MVDTYGCGGIQELMYMNIFVSIAGFQTCNDNRMWSDSMNIWKCNFHHIITTRSVVFTIAYGGVKRHPIQYYEQYSKYWSGSPEWSWKLATLGQKQSENWPTTSEFAMLWHVYVNENVIDREVNVISNYGDVVYNDVNFALIFKRGYQHWWNCFDSSHSRFAMNSGQHGSVVWSSTKALDSLGKSTQEQSAINSHM